MQRENGCPSCGFRLDVLSHWTKCPRCFRDLPTAHVEDPILSQRHAAGRESPATAPVQHRHGPAVVFPSARRTRGDHATRGGIAAGFFVSFIVVALALVAYVYMDLDLDGWATSEELRHGTDPMQGDTDGDGLADPWEANFLLDPQNPDTDYDGLGDGDELRNGTDPLAFDSNGNGLGDAQDRNPGEPNCLDARWPCDLREVRAASGPGITAAYFSSIATVAGVLGVLAGRVVRRRAAHGHHWPDNA